MIERDGPYYDGKVHVLSRKCDTCIFRPGNLMHLGEGRREQMVAESVTERGAGEEGLPLQGVIACHDTIHRDDGVRRVICRGFYDVHGTQVILLRLAVLKGVIEFVDPPAGHPLMPASAAATVAGRRGGSSAGTGHTARRRR